MLKPVSTQSRRITEWLCELGEAIREAVKIAVEKAITCENKNLDWVSNNLAQAVLNGDQVFWTS